MANQLGAWLLRKAQRIARTVNRADPTMVVRYDWPRRRRLGSRWRVTLTASWGIELQVEYGYLRWWSYDGRIGRWLFSVVESAHFEQTMAEHEDPMGRLADYE